MVPANFANYFMATASAGAALIGLLFVAVSIRPESTFGSAAHPVRRSVAAAAFMALANAFFVSLSALIPAANVGVVSFVASAVGIVLTLSLARELLAHAWRAGTTNARWSRALRIMPMLGMSLLLYGYELKMAIGLLLHPTDVALVVGLTEILLGVYAVGLVRAWELLGAPRMGLGRWLNPFRDDDAAAPDDQPPLRAGASAPGDERAPGA